MKTRIAIAYIASVLLGALIPLEATLAQELEAYMKSDAAQRMCQVQGSPLMSLAVPQAPCTEPIEDLPCTALAGDVEKPDAAPIALAANIDIVVTPALTECAPPSSPNAGDSAETGGVTALSHIRTVVLRV